MRTQKCYVGKIKDMLFAVEGVDAAVRLCAEFDKDAHHRPSSYGTELHIYGTYPFHIVFYPTYVMPDDLLSGLAITD